MKSLEQQNIIYREKIRQLEKEMQNMRRITDTVKAPKEEIIALPGIDAYGDSLPLYRVGGDHITWVDFNKRYDLDARIAKAKKEGRINQANNLSSNKERGGILVIDAAGHSDTDKIVALVLHQMFLLGTRYELENHGEITRQLFEEINIRCYNSFFVDNYATMLYGEIHTNGTFRFISAGHPPPVVFSKEHDCFVRIPENRLITLPVIGWLPNKEDIDREKIQSIIGYKREYCVNEINLISTGDILFLYTDGITEHVRGEEPYYPLRFEQKVREVKHLPAIEMYHEIMYDISLFGERRDDVTLAIVKKI